MPVVFNQRRTSIYWFVGSLLSLTGGDDLMSMISDIIALAEFPLTSVSYRTLLHNYFPDLFGSLLNPIRTSGMATC